MEVPADPETSLLFASSLGCAMILKILKKVHRDYIGVIMAICHGFKIICMPSCGASILEGISSTAGYERFVR